VNDWKANPIVHSLDLTPVQGRDFGIGALFHGGGKNQRFGRFKDSTKIRNVWMILKILQTALPLTREVKPVIPFTVGTGCGRARRLQAPSIDLAAPLVHDG